MKRMSAGSGRLSVLVRSQAQVERAPLADKAAHTSCFCKRESLSFQTKSTLSFPAFLAGGWIGTHTASMTLATFTRSCRRAMCLSTLSYSHHRMRMETRWAPHPSTSTICMYLHPRGQARYLVSSTTTTCMYLHPRGQARYLVSSTTTTCMYLHPRGQVRYLVSSTSTTCMYLHPRDQARYLVSSTSTTCMYLHPRDQARYLVSSTSTTCMYLHPRDQARYLVSSTQSVVLGEYKVLTKHIPRVRSRKRESQHTG